jgi:hypothetical protein
VTGGAELPCHHIQLSLLPSVSRALLRSSKNVEGQNALRGRTPQGRRCIHTGFQDRVVSSSGFGDSDIDVFFYGLSPSEATAKLEALGAHLNGVRNAV